MHVLIQFFSLLESSCLSTCLFSKAILFIHIIVSLFSVLSVQLSTVKRPVDSSTTGCWQSYRHVDNVDSYRSNMLYISLDPFHLSSHSLFCRQPPLNPSFFFNSRASSSFFTIYQGLSRDHPQALFLLSLSVGKNFSLISFQT